MNILFSQYTDLKSATNPGEVFYPVANWAPKLKGPYDRVTFLGKNIALSLARALNEQGQKTKRTSQQRAYKKYSEKLNQLRYRYERRSGITLSTACKSYIAF